MLDDEGLAGESGVALACFGQVFRADAQRQGGAGGDAIGSYRDQQSVAAGQGDGDAVGGCGRRCDGQEVHLRGADEACYEAVAGVAVEFQRGAYLLDTAFVEDDDLVRQRHGFDLIVGHIDHRRLEVGVQLGDFDAHLDAERGVEVGQRFVEQEDFRLVDDGAADGDALALAAGKCLGLALEQRFELEDSGGVLDEAVDLGLGLLRHLQAEGDVVVDRHVRVERVGLEHHRHTPVGRFQVSHVPAADADLALGDVFEPGDGTEQRGFSAAGRADEDHELAVLDVQLDVVQDLDITVGFFDAVQPDFGHSRLPSQDSCFCPA